MQGVREERYPTDIEGLLLSLREARSSLVSAIEGCSEKELTELRDASGWSVKDHLYHLAIWVRAVRYVLERRPLHEGVELTAEQYRGLDVDRQNAVAFERNRDRSLEDVLQVLHHEHQKLVDYLESPAMSWEDLQKPFKVFAPDDPFEEGDSPVLIFVLNETVDHFEMHQEWIEEILASDQSSSS